MDKQPLPREVQKWLQSLSLSYRIKNLKRDLGNGYLIAEIISRYPEYKLDIRKFNTGNNEENRNSNWVQLKKLTKLYSEMPLNDEIIDRLNNKAPNQAFETLIALYKYLVKKEEVFIIRKIDETDKFKQYTNELPKHMFPTASKLLKDHEINRIADKKVRNELIWSVLQNHRQQLEGKREMLRDKLFTYNYYNNHYKKKERIYTILNKSDDFLFPETEMRMSNNNISRDTKTINFKTEGSNDSKADINKKEEKVNLIHLINKDFGHVNNNNVFGCLTNNQTLLCKPSLSSDYNVEENFNTIIKKYFVDTDHNIELEFKKYSEEQKEKSKDYLGFFFDKFSLCSEDKLKRIFDVLRQKEQDGKKEESAAVTKFITIISKTLIEIESFLRIITTFIDILQKNMIAFKDILHPALRVCNGVLEKDKLRCETIFLSIGLPILLDVINEKPYFRNYIFEIIYNLITNNKHSHLYVLKSIKSRFIVKSELNFYHMIAKWMEFTTDENLDREVAEFYLKACIRGIKSDCDIIKSKSIYMILIFMRFNEILLKYSEDIFSLTQSFNWEVLSLVLIYCSSTLKKLNIFKEEKDELQEHINLYSNENNQQDQGDQGYNAGMETIEDKNELASKGEASIETDKENLKKEIGGFNQESILPEEVSKQAESMHNEVDKENKSMESKKSNKEALNQEENKNNIEENNEDIENLRENLKFREKDMMQIEAQEKRFLSIIDKIFQIKSPNMTIKIGFIYLADILHYYPNLAIKYMKILVEFKYDQVRKEVLEVVDEDKESEYTMHCYTEKYKTCGAPLLWNPLVIAGIFRDYIQNNELERLEKTHIVIFHSIVINQNFYDEDSDQWLEFYNDLKNYLFMALCEAEFSDIALDICKKFYEFEKIVHILLEVMLL